MKDMSKPCQNISNWEQPGKLCKGNALSLGALQHSTWENSFLHVKSWYNWFIVKNLKKTKEKSPLNTESSQVEDWTDNTECVTVGQHLAQERPKLVKDWNEVKGVHFWRFSNNSYKFKIQVCVCHSRPASCAGMSQTDDLGQNGHKDLNEVQAQFQLKSVCEAPK